MMRHKVQSGGSHCAARRREDIGLNDVWSDHCKAQPGIDRLAAVRIEDVLTFLIGA